jgi:hypothetical protein
MSEQLPPNSVPMFDDAENPKAEDLLYLVQGGLPNRDRKIRLDKLLVGDDDGSGNNAVIANLDIPDGTPIVTDTFNFASGTGATKSAKKTTLRNLLQQGFASCIIDKRYTSGTAQKFYPAGMTAGGTSPYFGNLFISAMGWTAGDTATTTTTYLLTKLPSNGFVFVHNNNVSCGGGYHLKIVINGHSVQVRVGETATLFCHDGNVISSYIGAQQGSLNAQNIPSITGLNHIKSDRLLQLDVGSLHNAENGLQIIGGGIIPSKSHGIVFPHGGADDLQYSIANAGRVYANANKELVYRVDDDGSGATVNLTRATPVHSAVWTGVQTSDTHIPQSSGEIYTLMGYPAAYSGNDWLMSHHNLGTRYFMPNFQKLQAVGFHYIGILGVPVPEGQTLEVKIVPTRIGDNGAVIKGDVYWTKSFGAGTQLVRLSQRGVGPLFNAVGDDEQLCIGVYMRCTTGIGYDANSICHRGEMFFREPPLI